MNKIVTIYLFNKKQNSGLILLALLSVALMLLRVKITHEIYLLFLIWNLFLGYIPYFFSYKIKTAIPGTIPFYVLLLGWLLFIPNSFYLITDFVHLHYNSGKQYLFDAILLTSFTIAGFYAGITSLFHIHSLLEMKFTPSKCRIIIVAILYLSAFGVYLGRILRFNSWDILSHPINLFNTVFRIIFEAEVYYFTAVLGTFILLVYLLSNLLFHKKSKPSC